MTMAWPPGLTDQTPLPFSLWRILELLAVRYSGQADPLRFGPASEAPSDAQIQEALALARQYAERAQQQERVLDDALIREVNAALIASVGPMGAVMVEDVLEELPSPVKLSVFLRTLGAELQPNERQVFGRHLRSRGLL